MLSVETENKLAKLLLTLADGESSVETTRQVLATTYGFDAYSLFRLVDVESKGFIDSVNLVEILRKYSIYASNFEAQQIIFHYDIDLSNTLNYSEFLNLVISDRNIILKHSSSSYKPFEPIPYDVEASFIRLLEKELALVKSVYSSIRDISLRYDFNVTDAFRAVDVLGIDNINSESVRKFLIRNYVTPSEQDIVNIIKRLDINKDYRIDYIELKNIFSSYSYGYTSTSTVIQYSPLRRTYYYSPIRTHLYCSPRRCYSPLRSYYSPVKTRTIYSPIRESPKVYVSTGFKSSSPIKTYTSEVLSRSPKRVESPNRKQQILSPRTLSTGFSQSIQENKYTTYEEELFQKYIKELIQVESSLETNKNEVALKSDFNMEDVFTIFEKYNKGFISEFDFKDGLNRYFSLFPLSDEISVLFKRYDNEKNLSLR